MQKTIEQIIQLAQNPHYTLSNDELETLKKANKKGASVKNRNLVVKAIPAIEKHGYEMPQVDEQKEQARKDNE